MGDVATSAPMRRLLLSLYFVRRCVVSVHHVQRGTHAWQEYSGWAVKTLEFLQPAVRFSSTEELRRTRSSKSSIPGRGSAPLHRLHERTARDADGVMRESSRRGRMIVPAPKRRSGRNKSPAESQLASLIGS